MINYVVAILLGSFIFFIINAFYETRRYANLSRVEKLSAQIDEEQRLIDKKSFLENFLTVIVKIKMQIKFFIFLLGLFVMINGQPEATQIDTSLRQIIVVRICLIKTLLEVNELNRRPRF